MKELYHKFTSHLKEAFIRAQVLARNEHMSEIMPRHLFFSLSSQQGSLASEILHKQGVQIDIDLSAVSLSEIGPQDFVLDSDARAVVQHTVQLAFEQQHQYVGTEHLLAALLKRPSKSIVEIFEQKNVSVADVRKEVETVLNSTSHFGDLTDLFSEVTAGFKHVQQREAGEFQRVGSAESLLETYAITLTDPEHQDDIDPLVGREKEVDRLIQILSRRTKNNPLLLGEPGVGKTAIVEGLARRIVAGTVPPILRNKKILALDLSLLVAGTMYRGEFESRLKSIIEQMQAAKDTILFIDEIHTIIGAGSSTGGTLDAANILKPSLARGELRCIGATTMGEYRKSIESDPALDRRFQPIIVREPTAGEAVQILRGIKSEYEQYHHVKLPIETLQTAVKLSERYIPERRLPDKAIDLIDEAAARARVKASTTSVYTSVQALEKKLEQLHEKKEELVLAERFDEAWDIKKQQKQLANKLATLKKKVGAVGARVTITPDDIAIVVSQVTSVPYEHIVVDKTDAMKDVAQLLQQRIVGQQEGISAIAQVFRRARAGLIRPGRPMGTFMFLGPSGVGKTSLARAVAESVFDSSDALIRVDMSEFSERHTVSKLVGAPAGYVGYKESGMLTESVRRRPYSVVLFDEIEKAHPDIFNVLLQVLDEGYITDATGMRINFSNTVIIMTSNIGAEHFTALSALGFEQQSENQHFSQDRFGQIKSQVLRELERHFRPEFLNRIDQTIVFNPLTVADLTKIVDMEITQLRNRLKQQAINLRVRATAKKLLAQRGYTPQQGARAIARVVQEHVEQPIIERILNQQLQHGQTITLTTKGSELVFVR